MRMFTESNEDLDEVDGVIPFVGRRRELEEVKAWFRLSRHRLIQIYGPPFTGKHSLAKQIQNDLVTECRERQLPIRCIDMSGECSGDWNEWLDGLAYASGTQISHEDTEQSITKHIRKMASDNQLSRLLLVFTKVDRLVYTSALQQFCQKIIELSGNIFLLVTSQMRIIYPPSIPVRATFLAGITESEGIILLQNVAHKSAIDLTTHARDIVRGCCYLPGIIMQAAMLLNHPQHVVGVEDLVNIVQTPGSLMKLVSFHKQKLQHFFDRMSESGKKGAMLLTLFQGSFSKAAAKEVLSPPGKAGDSACVSLIELCDQSVVSRCTDSDRYEIPAFLHEFLTEKIHNVTELSPGRLQFVKFFCRTLQAVDQKVYVHGRDRVLSNLHGDFDNVRQLMQQSIHCTQEMFPLLMQTVVSAEELFTVCFSSREVQLFYDSLMDAASVFGTTRDRALILWLMAQNSKAYMKDTLKHMDVLEQCKAANTALQSDGPSYHLAAVKGMMGVTYTRRGNAKKGHSLLREALDMLSGLERTVMIARREVTLMSHLAISEMYLDKHNHAESTVDRAMQIACRETPHHPAIAVMINTMGLIWENSGRSQVNAMRYYRWSLEERRTHSYFRAENLVPAILNVSLQLVRTGNCSAALNTLEEAIVLRKQYGWIDHFTAVTLYYYGIVYMQIGNFSRALDYHQQAVDMLELCTPQHPVAFKTINAVAHCHLAMKEECNARRSFDHAIAKYHKYKTDDLKIKMCALRHCLLLGDTHQRKSALSCLQQELLEVADPAVNIEQQSSECRDVYLANEGEYWNENGRKFLSKYCLLCQNSYRVFSHCENDAQLQTNVVCLHMAQSQRQQSESSDSDLTKSQREPSESSDTESSEYTEQSLHLSKESLDSG